MCSAAAAGGGGGAAVGARRRLGGEGRAVGVGSPRHVTSWHVACVRGHAAAPWCSPRPTTSAHKHKHCVRAQRRAAGCRVRDQAASLPQPLLLKPLRRRESGQPPPGRGQGGGGRRLLTSRRSSTRCCHTGSARGENRPLTRPPDSDVRCGGVPAAWLPTSPPSAGRGARTATSSPSPESKLAGTSTGAGRPLAPGPPDDGSVVDDIGIHSLACVPRPKEPPLASGL